MRLIALALACLASYGARAEKPGSNQAGASQSQAPLNVVSTPFKEEECDLMANGAICLFGGRKVLLPDALPKGLVGHWTFDAIKPLDSSGNYNHGKNPIPPGPGVGSTGSSAMFNGFDYVEIPHSQSFTSPDYSVSFWAYLTHQPVVSGSGKQCPLLHKGGVGDDQSPSFTVSTQSRKVRFVQSTDSSEFPDGEFVESHARMPVQRWTHVALVRTGHDMQLWINGILEAERTTATKVMLNEGPLYIGSVPWMRDSCNLRTYIDEVRVYTRRLTRDEIQAEAAPALGGVEPAFLHFGCEECTVERAAEVCREGYHLCTAMELHTGGYQAARTMGYVDWSSPRVWTHGMLKDANAKGEKGIGLCCTDTR